ncbi:MAG TPA: 3-keto-5-aminohexanoate cleavage protein [Solirubrobacteraceae bacterium]|nr:3-keto-5-aminohexanoate cleavage protein [Solirubrobacteraceae bacterium]
MGIHVQSCLNGTRPAGAHPALPVTAAELAAEARAAAAAGARSFHVHPRDADGAEALDAPVIDTAVAAIRAACPGLPVGVSTAAWIAPDVAARVAAIRSWKSGPDFASVNLSEDGHREVMAALRESRIGVEAGVWSVGDVGALAESGFAAALVRVLVEAEDHDAATAVARAAAIDRALDRAGIDAPRLHHGAERATWAVLRRAVQAGHDIRVGLEDTLELEDGTRAAGNADLVAAAVALAG